MPLNQQAAQAVGVIAQTVAERLFDRTVMPDIIGQIAVEAAKACQAVPVKRFEVQRQTPKGPVVQHISLPEALVEVADRLMYSNAIALEQLKATNALTEAIVKNSKLCLKILKQNAIDEDN